MLKSQPIFLEFPTRKKIWVTFTECCEKNVLCEKGDEITRFDGTNYDVTFTIALKALSIEMDMLKIKRCHSVGPVMKSYRIIPFSSGTV
jgi:hypothetical protein